MALKIVRRTGREVWYIRGTVNSKRHDESTGTADRKLADAYRVKREHELQHEAIHGKETVAKFAQAALSYLENGGSKRYLRLPMVELGPLLLADIGQDRIDWLAKKLYPVGSPSTWNRQVYTPVVSVLRHAAQKQWCERPVIKRPKAPQGRVRWLTKWDAQHLISQAAPHLKPLLYFLLYTGARVGEALWLPWDQVDLTRRTVTFTKTKNGTARSVPLHRALVPILASLAASFAATGENNGAVFLTDAGVPYRALDPDKPEDHSAGSRIKTAFHSATRRAGLSNLHPHDLRHTWATWHYQANRDLGALMRLGGWKTMSMVMRYAHTNVDELADTVDRL